MTTMTCPLGHTDDISAFHRPTGNVTGGAPVFINSILICPECKVLFRRKSVSEEAMMIRMSLSKHYEPESD
jgi:hypothetical protein